MAALRKLLTLLAFLVLAALSNARHEHGDDRRGDEGTRSRRHHLKESPFVLREPVKISETEAGDIQVLPGPGEYGALARNNIGLTIISMEPKALLLPQYLDASCVFYVHKGEMTLGWVEEDQLMKQDLKTGDIYALPGGFVFYILNTDEAQRLRLYGMCDSSESLESGHFQSFFVGGGDHPVSILSGFDKDVLGAAFKIASEDVADLLSSRSEGPIIYTTDSEHEYLRASQSNAAGDEKSPKPFNLLEKKPDFKNENGWTIAVDGKEFNPLKKAGVGVFAASLNPSAMLAPHWNPRAAEVAFVTAGRGTIQASYPNGTNAVNEEVEEGTVFFVPRYFPMTQIASRDGAFEFVGFSSTSHHNRPQFLVGSNSVLKAFEQAPDILSISFGISKDRLKELLEPQTDAVILPGFIEEDEDESRSTV